MGDMDQVKSFVETAVGYASKKCESAIARGVLSSVSQIRFSQNRIDIAKQWESLEFVLFVNTEGAKIGIAERSVTSEDEVRRFVDDTIGFTRALPESQFFTGIEKEIGKYEKIKDRYDSKFDGFVEDAPSIVNSAIDAAREQGARRVAGALMLRKQHLFFRSSYGSEGSTQETMFDLNVRAFQEKLDHSGQGLWCGTLPTKSVKEMIRAGAQAGDLAKKAEGAEQGEPGTYDLVLSPTVAANVIGFVPDSANPFMVLIGQSALGDKMGEQIAPEFVNVVDNPLLPGGLTSRPFDFEGTPTRPTPIIENGVLKSFLHNTTTADMYGAKSTGSSAVLSAGSGLRLLLPNSSNLIFEPGDYAIDELLEGSKPTIYVTCNWYTRYQNYQTGEFSTIPRDAMFLVNDGEMTPIKNLRISDNVLRMFANISALGKEAPQIFWWEVTTPTTIPAVKVNDCRMTAATL
ncbi:MAG: TldD/PmbA family protein [Candidatus Thorarchaeota archaeon]|nr:MAG: TldD/PmbA family protein [Candidatus Thorarchaeota archaeon]